MNQHYELEGRFRLVKTSAVTGEVTEDTGWFKNLITNAGLNALGTRAPYGGGCVVGTGSAPPQVTDLSLQNQRARATQPAPAGSSNPYSQTPPYWSAAVRGWRFTEGAASGNLTEVGIAYAITGGATNPVFSRALIKDAEGNPTTLVVLSNEILDVFYELRVYMQETDHVSAAIPLLGVPTVFTTRAALVAGGGQYHPATAGFTDTFNICVPYSGGIGPTTGSPTGTTGPGITVTSTTYVEGSLKRSYVASFTLTDGNIAGNVPHKSYRLLTNAGGSLQYQVELDKPFPKNSTNALNFTVTISWARKTI